MKNKVIYRNINSSLGFLILPLVLVILCVIVNQFAPQKLQFPEPKYIFKDLLFSITDKSILIILGNTFKNILIALFVSFVFGVFFGLILGYNRKVWNLSQPTVDFFRSIPVTFLIPATALLLGVTSSNIVWILSTYPCILIMILNVRAGLTKQERERVLSFSMINGATKPLKIFFKVTIFEILPDISTGFRIALSYCIVIVTVLEYLNLGNNGNSPGIGKLISQEADNLNYTRVYALIFLIGFIGFFLNKIVEILDYSILHWSKSDSNDNTK
ncbi:MAG: ABC transporter permease subunit [Saprospiraceae bacterium]|nr:ABC transporter permease subunit [Saprospiraceae bacterium]